MLTEMDGKQIYGLCQDDHSRNPVPLKQSEVHVTIQGFVANVESKLTYCNVSAEQISTTFIFPVDDASAVYKFEAFVNQKKIVAECQEKTQARETYEAAISAGLTAMYLAEDDHSGDVFECKLGNLPAEMADLTMCYVIELSPEVDGILRFTLPMVLNPRYSPDIEMDKPQKNDEHVEISSVSKLILSASICGHHKVKDIKGNHKFDVSVSEDKLTANVKLSEDTKVGKDLRFDVEYENISDPEVVYEHGNSDKDGLLKEDVLMLNLCPQIQGLTSEDRKREFVIVIDRSGSMGGDRMKKAKETLLLLLKSLPVGCLFNIVSFGSSFSILFDKSQEYSDSSLNKALELQKSMDSDMGGTEILTPLKKIYSNKCNPAYPRQIFLLTDGEVSNTNEVIALAKKNCNNTRVFTFGIGDGCSTSLIKNVASVSNGEAVFIKDNDNMKAKVISMMKSSFNGLLKDIKIEYSLPEGVIATPIAEPKFIADRKSLTVFTLLKSEEKVDDITGRVTIKGTYNDDELSFSVDITSRGSDFSELPLHRLAAKTLIDQLENDETGIEEEISGTTCNKDKIVLVSLAANVVSQYTAFVGFDKDSREPVSVLSEVSHQYDNMHQYCLKSAGLMSYGDSGMKRTMKKYGASVPGRMTFLICCLPCVACLSCAKCCRKRRKKSKKNRTKNQKTPLKSQGIEDLSDSEVLLKNKDSGETLMDIVSLQNFDGSWSPNDKLNKILGITDKQLSTNGCFGNQIQTNVWCTASVVVYLEEKFAGNKTEWEMICDKAVRWLESQDRNGREIGEIFQEIRNQGIV